MTYPASSRAHTLWTTTLSLPASMSSETSVSCFAFGLTNVTVYLQESPHGKGAFQMGAVCLIVTRQCTNAYCTKASVKKAARPSMPAALWRRPQRGFQQYRTRWVILTTCIEPDRRTSLQESLTICLSIFLLPRFYRDQSPCWWYVQTCHQAW